MPQVKLRLSCLFYSCVLSEVMRNSILISFQRKYTIISLTCTEAFQSAELTQLAFICNKIKPKIPYSLWIEPMHRNQVF